MHAFQHNQIDTAQLRDQLTGALIGLARATEGNDHMLRDSTAAVTVAGLIAIAAGSRLDRDGLLDLIERVDQEKRKLVPACYECAASCGRTSNYDMRKLGNSSEAVQKLKLQILSGACDVAALAAEAGKDEAVSYSLYRALYAIGMDDWAEEELQPIVQELDEMAGRCAAMLKAQ